MEHPQRDCLASTGRDKNSQDKIGYLRGGEEAVEDFVEGSRGGAFIVMATIYGAKSAENFPVRRRYERKF